MSIAHLQYMQIIPFYSICKPKLSITPRTLRPIWTAAMLAVYWRFSWERFCWLAELWIFSSNPPQIALKCNAIASISYKIWILPVSCRNLNLSIDPRISKWQTHLIQLGLSDIFLDVNTERQSYSGVQGVSFNWSRLKSAFTVLVGIFPSSKLTLQYFNPTHLHS